MKAQRIILAVVFLFALAMTSCTKSSVDEDGLYETEAVDLTKVHRPGSGGQ
ncbi:hypothetical protein [Maribacter sp. ACAM166]|uniref:hypothetical protein n=1 Tax=Maribacter sp. ACAM166 TaxID=2508996 RepID=UPI001485361C|nr:hypothetical protein [Maribacter sp. ACAM166]